MSEGALDKETEYRAILRRAFDLRCRRNPKYSLRAFARDLGLSAPSLSEVLKGKQGLSPAAAQRIAGALGLPPEVRALFILMVEARHARSETRRAIALKRLRKLGQSADDFVLKEDVFALIADWYHFALLELLRYARKTPTPQAIARRLGVTQEEAATALDRLRRLELITVDKGGQVRVTKNAVASPSGIPSAAIRGSHKQILNKALDALEAQGVAQRDFSALMLAVDPARMDEAKKALLAFGRRFQRAFEHPHENSEIYCLSMQFFALSRPNLA